MGKEINWSKWNKYKADLRRRYIDKQKKPCCKYWIKMWIDKIADAIRDSDGGIFRYCPECRTLFKKPKEI